jgi:hypothetical protein
LAVRKKLLGGKHPDFAVSLAGLAAALGDQGKLAEAETLQREELALWRELSQKEVPEPVAVNGVMDSMARLIRSLLAEEKFTEAEPLARECLALCEKESPNDWLTFQARSLLGGSLLGQKKFNDAEPFLLSGFEGMQQRAEKIPLDDKPRRKEALQRIVQLYEASAKPEKAAAWKKRLESTP